jgi:hypothetical protein
MNTRAILTQSFDHNYSSFHDIYGEAQSKKDNPVLTD